MTAAAMAHGADPHHVHGLVEAEHLGPAPKRIVTGYGFWIFLLSDMVMFSCFFAAYAVLAQKTAGGPHGSDLFDLKNVAIETGCLLMSSFVCGMASIAADVRSKFWFQIAMAVTCVLGLAFLFIEFREFAALVARGAGPSRSAFLSAFFTLVGCHGLHVSAGILWLLTMMAQVFAKGFRADIERRFLCFALFWHALDIIWVAVFSVVYLLGSGA
jgi:cytochrome o ubiquinol oxidase subunit 3